MKKYLNINVYEAVQERLKYIFEEFDNIYVSFSGGKDSGLLLNLVINFMKEHRINKKIGVFIQDMEAQFPQTIEFIERMLKNNMDFMDPYYFCVELVLRNSFSIHKPFWITWDKTKKDVWMRNYPAMPYIYKENPFKLNKRLTDKEHYKYFSKWLHKHKNANKTISLTGLRADESLSRYNAVVNIKNYYKNKKWIAETEDNIYNAKPIFDWETRDIWIANNKLNFDYNKLYDLLFQSGVPLDDMRVASPFLDQGQKAINTYRVIAPDIWQKLLLRAEGINFGVIYSNTKAFGRDFQLPKGYTWKQYTKFLLTTLPTDIRDNYIRMFKTSIKFWKEKGGGLREEIIEELKNHNIKIKKNGISPYARVSNSTRIIIEEYPDSIDFIASWEVPSWKRFAIAILKNDYSGRIIGFGMNKEDIFKKIIKSNNNKKMELAYNGSKIPSFKC
ncbi:MAG: DUF3440 domain-containing protein [Alphaproteobacteria bacterium]|jgi:predicted phosphoadenosine phosphosulfate sulfurtransferase|nr:DUF3440 domain-containing protein [Alphaproteobacteria bacterium]